MASSKLSPDIWRLRWATFRRWSGTRRRLVCEAFVLLGLCRCLILAVPFRLVAPRLMGWFMAETLKQLPAAQADRAAEVGWAVRRMADHTPWASTCLAQAMAAQNMLGRRGIGSTVYLGLARHRYRIGGLEAHAWLRCGDTILTGEEEMGDFQTLVSYALDAGGIYRPSPVVQWWDTHRTRLPRDTGPSPHCIP